MIAALHALRLMMMLQAGTVIDDFESISQWKAIPSDDVTLRVGQDAGVHGKAMRLDFDFHGHGGYAVIHRDVKLPLPANYEFTFSIRGDAPLNTLEFKLVDPSGENVWWYNQPNFVFPKEWRTVAIKKRHITFAWGPLGGGEMKNVAGIELAITAGTGGKGTVWIDDLKLTSLEPQGVYNLKPKTTLGGSPSARYVEVDFLKRREFGGLALDWDKALRPPSYSLSTSIDGKTFTPVYSVGRSTAQRDYLYLPESDARYLRFTFPAQAKFKAVAPYVVGLKDIAVKPLAWSATMNDFFNAVAHDARPGSYPRYFSGKQSYWTVIGVNGDTREGLIDEQAALESGKGQFSIEPFLLTNGKLITWNDAVRSTGSVGDGLPIPTATWKTAALEMTLTGFASGEQDSSVLYARYRIRNLTSLPQRATLYVAIRPFQVNPPWQFLNTRGGFAPIDSISYSRGLVKVNADRMVIPLTAATGFGAMSFDEGNIVDMLRQSRLPSSLRARDPLGRASGALSWDIRLASGSDTTIDVAVPLHPAASPCLLAAPAERCGSDWANNSLATVEMVWREKLNRVAIQLPRSASRIATSIRANLGYILINRDGPAIQPGSRSYERSWIRDGSLTSTALLRLGQFDEVREFINWYARFQFANGKIPCCVDSRGADPVPENDSNGEFIYVVAEYYRHTGNRQQLEKLWPNVSRAFAFMDSLRLSRTTEEYRSGDKRVFFGLMPQSISHEGYSAKPMHSYWDDFFALRGFKDAAEIARILDKPEVAHYADVVHQFRRDLYASIRLSMAQHKIDYIPGAAELGDFDATSTTIAVSPADELANLPQPALNRTFQKYYENFVIRRAKSKTWDAYTPYEWRVVGAFVRLGDKSKAHEVADFFFRDQRPQAWHQWAEVVYRDSLKPQFIGDMPHTWVGSDFIRSALDMFAFEREADSSLVIGAGIPEKWVRDDDGLSISGLSTHYGVLSYAMHANGSDIEVRIDGEVRVPSGGVVVRSPSDRRIRQVLLNGDAVANGPGELVVRKLPAVVTFRY